MTLPVYNLKSAIVDIINGKGYLIEPWNSFFQQLTQKAPAVQTVTKPSPFKPNSKGTVVITGATTITLTRGKTNITLTGQTLIPMSIGDSLGWTGAATVQFLGS